MAAGKSAAEFGGALQGAGGRNQKTIGQYQPTKQRTDGTLVSIYEPDRGTGEALDQS